MNDAVHAIVELPRHAGDAAQQAFALDVLHGLSATNKTIPEKYLYDACGSELFSQITRQPEYYLTACEHEILARHAGAIVEQLGGEPCDIVELGAGDGHKTQLLLRAALAASLRCRYVPVDICEAASRQLVEQLRRELPALRCEGLVGEYLDALRFLGRGSGRRHLVLFLGSSIGNLDRAGARTLLRTLWSVLDSGDLLLVGFDLKKDLGLLRAAYDDAAGVTRRFNLNLLRRINEELGGNFDLAAFSHHASYDVQLGAMQSFLVSNRAQAVDITALDKRFFFDPYEAIHVEDSFKYLPGEVAALAAAAGLRVLHTLYDERGWFLDVLLAVDKPQLVRRAAIQR